MCGCLGGRHCKVFGNSLKAYQIDLVTKAPFMLWHCCEAQLDPVMLVKCHKPAVWPYGLMVYTHRIAKSGRNVLVQAAPSRSVSSAGCGLKIYRSNKLAACQSGGMMG